MRLAALVPAGFLLGAAISRVLLTRHPQGFDVDLAQPLVVVTYWKFFGAQMFGVLLLSVAIACAGYVAVLRRVSTSDGAEPRRVLATVTLFSGLGCVAALAWPVIFSSDVYAYAAYGDLALRGLSPYAHVPPHLHDPLLDATAWQWSGTFPICVYGPAFVWIAKAVVAAALPLGTAAPLWVLRILACFALLSCAPIAYAAFARFPQSLRLTAAAGIALNPIAIWECASGHNDILAIAAVLAGFAVMRNRHLQAGAVLIALGVLIKAPALAASAAVVASAWRDRTRFVQLFIASAIAIGAAVLAALPLESAAAAHATGGTGTYTPQFSLQSALQAILPLWACVAIVAAAACALAVTGIRRLAAREFDGAIFLALGAWIAVPNPYPWYALWILPCAFLAWNSRAAWAVISATVLIVFRYYPDATSAVLPVQTGLAVTLLEFAVPLILFSAYMRDQSRRNRPEIRNSVPDFAPHRSE